MRFDDILLALLSRRPRSGYDLKQWLAVEGIFLRANADQAQIYRTLRKLENAELITHDVVRRGGPDAKIFRVTDRGADALRALASEPYEPPARWQEADFVAWVSLLGPVDPPSILSTIERELSLREKQISVFRGRPRERDLVDGPIEYDRRLIEDLSVDLDQFGRDSTDTWVAWLRTMKIKWSEVVSAPRASGRVY